MKEVYLFLILKWGVFMEFLGLSIQDFDFFRKKDKMTKVEYEKSRNEVKHHFRGLCYELQKIYHKDTDGVLDINKEFSSFSKKSMNISADYGEKTNNIKKTIEMNTENVCVKLTLDSVSSETSMAVVEILKNKSEAIFNYIMADKHNQINCTYKGKGSKIDVVKYNALELDNKSYNSLVSFIENNIKDGKHEFVVVIQHTCPKNEAIKQSKNLSNIIYEDLNKTTNLFIELS